MTGQLPLDRAQLSRLVAELADEQVTLWVQDGHLKFRAPRGGITDDVRATLRERRDELIRYLQEAGPESRSAPREHPLSHMQQRLWFLKQLQPGLAAYNMPTAVGLRGRLDVGSLQAALDAVLRRHESLRTRIVDTDGQARCVVEPHAKVEIQIRDVRDERDPDASAQSAVVEVANRPFAPADFPLLRALLVKQSEDHHVLCLIVDHLVGDGLSLNILLAELFSGYARLVAGDNSVPPPLALQYADFVAWQQQRLTGEAAERTLDYWKSKLAGIPQFLPLPTDKPRPSVLTYAGDRVTTVLAPELSKQLRMLARAEGATLFMVLMAAFQSLLCRLTGATDLAVGTAVANRGDGRFDQVIGFFANNIVLRGDLAGDPTMQEAIARVRRTALSAYAHEELQFDRLVEALAPARDLNRSPIFQVMFVLRSEPGGNGELGGLSFEPVDCGLRTARFDLAVDSVELPDGIHLSFEFNTDLYFPERIERMVLRFRRILEAMVEDPGIHLSALPLLEPDEYQILRQFECGPETLLAGAPFVHQFVEASAAHPQSVAVRCGDRKLTYGELNAAANRIANTLVGMGVGRGARVALCMERSEQLLPALLGIQKCGAAYVPLDPGFPAERLQYMLADSGASVLLTAAGAAAHIALPGQVQVLDLVHQARELATRSSANPAIQIDAADPVYVIYTSGSTGRPKGVAVSHGSLMNFLRSMAREPGLNGRDVLAAVTTISFDIAGLELYLPLLVGARIELVSRQEAIDGHALAARLNSSGATVLQATPATWRLLIEAGWRGAPGFRALCGGEALPQQLASDLLQRVSELWNLYGPTETTIWSTLEQVRVGQLITVGRPIANTQVYVLGASMERMPVGSPGEIWIGGDGVALGYHERPELTAERFAADPFSDVPGARLYRTGDLGRWTDEGRLEHLGRADGQVKIRGYRIELGEIEAVMERCEGVRQAAVVVRNAGSGNERLVGCVELHGAESGVTDLHRVFAGVRARLAEALPDYMVPRELVHLPSVPLTANGKVDRNTLSRMQLGPVNTSARGPHAPMSPTQQRVAELWKQVLQVSEVGAEDNFFDLGGHSLLLTRLQAAIKREFGKELPLVALFQHATVAGFAHVIDGPDALPDTALDAASRHVVQLRPATVTDAVPVFALPGHNGDILCYRHFSRVLDVPGAMYALRPPGVEGQGVPIRDLAELSDFYYQQIKALSPSGPCVVMGFCAGTGVALLLARRLQIDGRLRGVALVGGLHPEFFTRLGRARMTIRWLRNRLRHHRRELRTVGWRRAHHYLLQRLRGANSATPPARALTTALADDETRRRVEEATMHALATYRRGEPITAPIGVFVPRELWGLYTDAEVASSWREAGSNVRCYTCVIDDNGADMLLPPFVDVVAASYRQFASTLTEK